MVLCQLCRTVERDAYKPILASLASLRIAPKKKLEKSVPGRKRMSSLLLMMGRAFMFAATEGALGNTKGPLLTPNLLLSVNFLRTGSCLTCCTGRPQVGSITHISFSEFKDAHIGVQANQVPGQYFRPSPLHYLL